MDQSKAYEEYVLSKTNVQLETAELESLNISKVKEFEGDLCNELSFGYRMNEVNNDEIEAFLKVNINGNEAKDSAPVFGIECVYRGIFKTWTENSDEDFTHFVEVQVVPQLVPYARTIIASLSIKMGI